MQVIAQQLPQIGCNDFGVNKLRPVIFGLFVGLYMKEFLFECIVYVCLQLHVIAQQLFQIFLAYFFSIGCKVLIYQFGRTVENCSEQGGVYLGTHFIGSFQTGNVAVIKL